MHREAKRQKPWHASIESCEWFIHARLTVRMEWCSPATRVRLVPLISCVQTVLNFDIFASFRTTHECFGGRKITDTWKHLTWASLGASSRYLVVQRGGESLVVLALPGFFFFFLQWITCEWKDKIKLPQCCKRELHLIPLSDYIYKYFLLVI